MLIRRRVAKKSPKRPRARRSLFEILEARDLLCAVPWSGACACGGCGCAVCALPAVNTAYDQVSPQDADPVSALAPLNQTFQLHSLAGASHTIYLDFVGHTTSGTSWNSSFTGGSSFTTAAYDFTGDAGFSNAELERIQYIWQRVAEDFAPFNVNVTTQDPGAAALSKSGAGDTAWGIRVVIGGDGSWYSPAGGVAYINSFNWSSDTPVFVFEDNLGNGHEKYTAEAISHEVGHSLGLGHDGNGSNAYYGGHGSGATGWAAIMGVGYYQPVTQWSRGEYPGANNPQDDLAIITGNNGFGYRADAVGNTNATAVQLTSGTSVIVAGLIETNSDVDVFRFTTGAGAVNLTFSPAERGANLDMLVELYNSAGTLIATSNPLDALGASLQLTLAAGDYYVHVSGTGKGDPLAGGYSDYGSLGQYSISGTVAANNSTSQFAIAALAAQQAEGNTGSTAFTFQVTRSGDTSDAASVNWAVTGNGATAADFAGSVLPQGVLQFAAGETSKIITINVQGDSSVEGNEGFTVTLSGASAGTLITTASATGSILNDDAPPPGITVTPLTTLSTSEKGTSANFSVVLNCAPQADVVIEVTSLDTTEGVVNKSSLTFTAQNWNVAQQVTVTGVNDTLKDGTQLYTIRLGAAQSNDANYNGLDANDVTVNNQDDEKAGRKNRGGSGRKSKHALVANDIVQIHAQAFDFVADSSKSDSPLGRSPAPAAQFHLEPQLRPQIGAAVYARMIVEENEPTSELDVASSFDANDDWLPTLDQAFATCFE
jgi:hypothetical protein